MQVTIPKKKPKNPKSDTFSATKFEDLPGIKVQEPINPVIIGRFARPVGVRGELKARAENENSALIMDKKTVIVKLKNGFRQFNVLKTTQTGSSYRIWLEDFNSRNLAGLLTGCEMVIAASEVPALPESEYYIDDLINCQILNEDGDELGFLREVWQQDHHDVWVIESFQGEILIPAVKDFIINVDLVSHRITIRDIEGLWDEN
ncbi:ribosome maturation factor RimM [bacterium]|nr:ribosome maturation factor RimM [bacterium]